MFSDDLEVDLWIRRARATFAELSAEMRSRFDRDLPLTELLFDRWERARSLGFGEGSSIYHDSYVYGSVAVGSNTWIGPHTLLDGTGGLEIGNYCSISAGVQIYTHDTARWAVSLGKASYDREAVKIGDGCYVGSHTVIVKGVTIGSRSIIGACSFVNRDIPPFSVAMGVPCRRRGTVAVSADGSVDWTVESESQ